MSPRSLQREWLIGIEPAYAPDPFPHFDVMAVQPPQLAASLISGQAFCVNGLLLHAASSQISASAKEPNSPSDPCINGHGMRFGLEDQKPQHPSPPAPCWGFSFLGVLACSISINALYDKMLGPTRKRPDVFKFFVGQAVEFTPIGENVAGLYKILRQMPNADRATDLQYRVKSDAEAFERNVPEIMLRSGESTEREYALFRRRILTCIAARFTKPKEVDADLGSSFQALQK